MEVFTHDDCLFSNLIGHLNILKELVSHQL